jgi:predicted dehydrogenase
MSFFSIMIVGFGIAGNLHSDKMQGIPSAQVVGIVDIDMLKKSKADSKKLPFYSSIEEAARDKPLIWDVCVPNEDHITGPFN